MLRKYGGVIFAIFCAVLIVQTVVSPILARVSSLSDSVQVSK